jgi:hypothetical protein
MGQKRGLKKGSDLFFNLNSTLNRSTNKSVPFLRKFIGFAKVSALIKLIAGYPWYLIKAVDDVDNRYKK